MTIKTVQDRNGKTFWYDTAMQRYYHHEPIKVGDTLEYIGNRSNTFEKGELVVADYVEQGTYSDSTYIEGSYKYPYTMNFRVAGSTTKRSMKNWRKVDPSKKENTVLQLEVNKPTYVVELTRTVDADGKVVETEGTPVKFDSRSAARVYTQNQITASIRATNTYKEFRIYQEVDLVRAKQPEIEFV